jgi:hypothetical protein
VRNTTFIGDVETACTDSITTGQADEFEVDDSIDVILRTEHVAKYAVLHNGYAEVGDAKDARKIPVVVKLAFHELDKELLAKEFNIYGHLHASGVQGIPHCFGYFVYDSLIEGGEGPYALVISNVGNNIRHREDQIPRPVKYVLLPHFPSFLH